MQGRVKGMCLCRLLELIGWTARKSGQNDDKNDYAADGRGDEHMAGGDEHHDVEKRGRHCGVQAQKGGKCPQMAKAAKGGKDP